MEVCWPDLEDPDRFDDLPLEVDEISYILSVACVTQSHFSHYNVQLVEAATV